MAKEVRARIIKGKIEPVEPLDLVEGEEVVVSIAEKAARKESLAEALQATMGAWKDLVDAEKLKRTFLLRPPA